MAAKFTLNKFKTRKLQQNENLAYKNGHTYMKKVTTKRLTFRYVPTRKAEIYFHETESQGNKNTYCICSKPWSKEKEIILYKEPTRCNFGSIVY